MSRRLHIVRHGAVVVDPQTRVIDWTLANDAQQSVVTLLGQFDPSSLRRIISSREVKARQTADLLNKALGLPIEIRDGLEEHHRRHSDFMSAAAFSTTLKIFFANPSEIVFGEESADMSLQRFDAAIQDIMSETDDDELIISHGRVISLFLALRQKSDPMQVWSSLKLPDHMPIEWPGLSCACV